MDVVQSLGLHSPVIFYQSFNRSNLRYEVRKKNKTNAVEEIAGWIKTTFPDGPPSGMCACVRVRVCVHACVCVRACVRMLVYVRVLWVVCLYVSLCDCACACDYGVSYHIAVFNLLLAPLACDYVFVHAC